MRVRFYREELWNRPTARVLAIHGNDVVEQEAYAVLAHPGEDLPGFDGSRMALGQIRPVERYLRVIYVPEPERNSAFVLTAFTLRGDVLRACRARQRSRGQHRRGARQRLQIFEHGSVRRPWQDPDEPPTGEQQLPPGWDDVRAQRVIARYTQQSAEAQIAEDEAAARCLFGKPPGLATLSPSWRTATAVALGRRVDDSCDFSVLSILADALQDAGCDSSDVLDHCRGPGPHVRGCWVVDLVLGNE
jgi:hypothetical protein